MQLSAFSLFLITAEAVELSAYKLNISVRNIQILCNLVYITNI